MSLAVTADETQLGLKVAFLVLLYLFVWLVVRSATRGLSAGAPQESIVLPAAEAAALRAARRAAAPTPSSCGRARRSGRAPSSG